MALAIPTYRRPRVFLDNLGCILDEAARLNVPIYISDDSPDDEIERSLRPLRARHERIFYRRNTPSLGHDGNLIQTLLWPNEDYVWLVGDALRIVDGQLPAIMSFLGDQDFVFVNVLDRVGPSLPSLRGEAASCLIKDKLWHQTLTGATIYSARVTQWVCRREPEIYRNFPHLSVILGFASTHDASIGWFGPKTLESSNRDSYWRTRAIDVFVDDWAHVVGSFPSVISRLERRPILKSHSARTGLFNVDTLSDLKQLGQFRWSCLTRPSFFDVMHLSPLQVLAILLLPSRALAVVRQARRWLRSALGFRGPSEAL